MGYYVINFVSYAYTLREDTTCDRQIISSGELVVKAHYLGYMQENKILLGAEKSATSNNCSNTNYCTYMSWWFGSKRCSWYSYKYFQQKPWKTWFTKTSYMTDWLWSWLYPWINLT